MSKRVPIIVIGIIVLLLLVAPFGLGSLAESNLNRQIETMGSNPSLSFEITDYDRGWFSSRATIEAKPSQTYLQAAAAQDPMMQMLVSQLSAPFEVELGHGPILTLNGLGIGSYAVKATLDPATEWVQMAMTTLDVPYVFQLRGQAGIGTGFRFEGDVPSFETEAQGQTVSFSGLDFSGHTNGRDVSFESNSERLALQSTFLNLSLEGLGLNGAFELNPNAMSLGSGELIVNRFVAINPLLGAEEIVSLDELGVSASTALNAAGNIDYGLLYEAGSMHFTDSPDFSNIAVGISFTNLDYEGVQQMYQIASQGSAMSDPTVIAFQMLPVLDRLVAAGPGLSFDPVRVSMDGGQLNGTINASIDPSVLPTGQAMDLADADVMSAAVKADLSMAVSKDMLIDIVAMSLRSQLEFALPTATETQLDSVSRQQAEQMIQGIVDQGMVADDGDSYSTLIVVEDGIATVNGIPIPLGALGIF
jgi:uncharacterized protein YdgA (DUF945 family)